MQERWIISFIKTALVVFIIMLVFASCNLTYTVRNQDNNLEDLLHFPCGTVTLKLIGKGNSKFVLKQQFDLDNSIIVYMDSLRISFNDMRIKPAYNHKFGNSGTSQVMELVENKMIETSFELDENVFEGDTIRIYAPGFILCDEQIIHLDTIIFSFVNNIRIYGVNDF